MTTLVTTMMRRVSLFYSPSHFGFLFSPRDVFIESERVPISIRCLAEDTALVIRLLSSFPIDAIPSDCLTIENI